MTVRKARTDIDYTDLLALEYFGEILEKSSKDYVNSITSKAYELSQFSALFIQNKECIEFQNLNERKKSFKLSGK